jgi:virginiamycin A acetyltransferase
LKPTSGKFWPGLPLRALSNLRSRYLNRVEQANWYRDERYRNNTIGSNVVLGDAVLEGSDIIRDNVQMFGKVHVGRYTAINGHSLLHGGEITIGRYCEFAPYVTIYALNHGMDYITTYNHKTLFEGRLKTLSGDNPVRIGHDVWIGHGAMILPGVTIGHGAVIGASAVVTKDVEDYAIAAGNPARLIKKRFDDELIQLLLEWEWWNLEPAELEKHETAFFSKVSTDRDQIVSYVRSLREISSNGLNKV